MESSREGFRRENSVGISESLRFVKEPSLGVSVEYSELPDELGALLSRLDLLSFPRRWKIFLPKTCTLSGRSLEGLLLAVDRVEDCRVRETSSVPCSHVGRSLVRD